MNKIPVLEPDIGEKELEYVSRAVKSGWVSSNGEYIEKFENNFAKYCGRQYAITTSNGTHALHLALAALDIKSGDEVLVPNITFIATANAVSYTGAKPVMVDIDKNTWNINPQKIESKITEKTKAIIVVHLYGNPCDMEKILKIAEKHSLFVIEDAAEAHGSLYKGKKCGSFGDVSCFSFYGNKTITTGEGGMCLTNDPQILEKMNLFKHHGMTPYKEYNKKYWHEVVGFNYRMTNMQAALGLAQLERIDSFILVKKQNAALYRELLETIPGITFQKIEEESSSNCWLTTILIDEKSKFSCDQLAILLREKDIDTRNMFFALSSMPPYTQNDESLENSINISRRGISLPSSTKLKKSEIELICKIIKEALK